MDTGDSVWVFCGDGATLPSAVFSDLSIAEQWIQQYSLSGILTRYPINRSVYDWAIDQGFLHLSKPHQSLPAFVGRFTSAYLEHHHFENGHRCSANPP